MSQNNAINILKEIKTIMKKELNKALKLYEEKGEWILSIFKNKKNIVSTIKV